MNNVQSVKLSGRICAAKEEVDLLLAKGSAFNLDFAEVTFISVEGLEWLEELLLRAESANVAVNLVNVPSGIYKVFKVAHVDNFLKAAGAAKISGPVC